MRENLLLVTGMVRSGTTLISRSIDAHPMIACPPDPFIGFFIALHNDLLSIEYGDSFDPKTPLSDFFFKDVPDIQLFLNADFHGKVTHSPQLIQKKSSRFLKPIRHQCFLF